MPLRSLARKPLPKPDPRSDPRYLRVTQQLKTGATKVKAHPPAAKKAGDAAAASKGPPNERMAAGKTKQVEKIQDAKTSKPEPSSFLTLLRAEIEKAMPKTLGDTEKFMQGGKSEELKGGLKGNVSQQKTEATGQVASASTQQPAPVGEAKQEKPLPKDPAAPSPKVPGDEAMPAPKSDADVSLQDSKQDVDQEMKEAKVNDRQLQKANDPRFSAVLDAKGAVAKQADSAPAQYRSQEKGVLSSTGAKANTDATKNAAAMLGVRSSSGARVLTRQQLQKAKDEAKRKEITDKIETIYSETKARVEKKLADLDGEVNTMFDQGVDKALQIMTDYTEKRIRDYKIDRYLSIPLVGQARWIRDQFKGLPEEANAFYEEGRRVFQAAMDVLIVRVANLVELRLKEAKAEVAKGQKEIKAFVASQPKELQQFAQAAAKDVNDRFKDLEGSIEDKKNELASSLAGKYKEAFDKANEALKKIQDSNKGLVAAFVEKLGEIIKILREFKDKVMSLLAKARDAIDIIVDDPIGFLGNLIAAIKGGISKFVDNIWTHLKKGFMAWLFGSLPPGIEIPSDLSLPSILKLVLAVLGITYDRMRAKAVKLIGERNVKIIEKVVEYIRVLITGGPAALWEKVKEDLSNLKEMVIEAIQNWLITTLIKKAIEKIISMCNPVGAIIQAIIAIYNLVMFIVEKIQQILEFFEAIVNSIYNIATGAISTAINWIEQALARMIPILIGFLARLIGLGGITDKIREFILKIQSKVDKAIDKAIEKIVGFIKKLFGKGGKDAAASGTDPDALKEATYKKPFSMGDAGHNITAVLHEGKLRVTVASADADLAGAISSAIKSVTDDTTREVSQKNAILGALRPALARVQSVREDWIAAEAKDPRGGNRKLAYEKFMEIVVTDVINKLRPLAKYNITDLQHIIVAPPKRFIPTGFNIRKKLYDDATQGEWTKDSASFRKTEVAKLAAKAFKIWKLRDDKSNPANFSTAQGQWNAMTAAGELDPAQIPTFSSYDHPKHFPNFKYETDHKTPLGVSWNGGEKNAGDGDRKKTTLDKNNFQLLTETENRKKSGVRFDRDVGPDFTSGVNNSPKGSPTIGGKPFASS